MTMKLAHAPWRRSKSVLLSLAALLLTMQPSAAAEDVVDLWVEILHNSDAESELVNAGTGLEDFGGVARFSTLVGQLRLEALQVKKDDDKAKRISLTLCSGDNFLAGPEFSASLDAGVPFFETIAIDRIRYDALGLGNHEFDFGPDILADFIAGSVRPGTLFLSANLDFSGEPRLQDLVDRGRIGASRIVQKGSYEIGIIGAITPTLDVISSPRNVTASDVLLAVQAEIDRLESYGVNKIILISHMEDIAGDLALANQLRGVDVMIAGGSDELLANPGDLLIPGDGPAYGPYPIMTTDADGATIPVVTTTGIYTYVGRLVVGFDEQGNVIDIDDERSGPLRVAGGDNIDAVKPDPVLQALVVEPVAESLAGLAAHVVGISEVALDGRRTEVRAVETNEGNLVADSLFTTATALAADFGMPVPDVALQNGGGIRNNDFRGPGNISRLDTFEMAPFANFVAIVPGISRDQFKEILENAVSRVDGSVPGGTGRFAQISGFSMTWDAAGTPQQLASDGTVVTPGTRVQNVSLDDGTPIIVAGTVVPGAALTIATIDFLAIGGDEYPFRGAPFKRVGVTYQQALENHIEMTLGGLITAADYPEGGEGRITRIN
jgi:5'-nucleotidase